LILSGNLSPQNKILLTIFLFITAVIITTIFLRKIIYPFEKTREIIENLNDGKSENYFPDRNDRNYDFFRNLNEISEKLQYFREKITNRKEGFFTLLDSVPQPVWIQNRKGFITIGNESFEKFFQTTDVKGHYFWNVIRQKTLYDFIDEIYKNPQNMIKEIEFDENFYLCVASYLPATKQTMFILNDISEIKKLQNIKKDFVLNVSHELRTPLTSIKGYLEIMEGSISKENLSYLDVIKRNTERLIKIVEDLLTLSKLEHTRHLKIEKINIKEFIGNIQKIFAYKCQEKNLKMKVDIHQNLDFMKVDLFQMEQVFINLIDNAIKYSEQGNISIDFSKENSFMKIEITDTGIGITEEHLPRLFERFYVTNKSRSRKMGGTGLGLSIVKHIINLHNGEIKVESEIGKGTKFTIILPK